MKTTFELPEDLLRELEVEASRRQLERDEFLLSLVRKGLQDLTSESERNRSAANQDARRWIDDFQSIGSQIYRESKDERSMVEILQQDRR